MRVIYEPKGKAREYEALAVNPIIGCDHGCTYCYGPATLHMSREEFQKPKLRDSFLHDLAADAMELEGSDTPIMVSFVGDPYCHYEAASQLTRHTIEILHAHNLRVSILTKGGSRAWRDFDLLTPRDKFGVTLTFLRGSHSEQWEPYAASPSMRIVALREAHQRGIPTWVSLEPVIDPDQTLHLLRLTHEFVNVFKIGKLNYRKSTFDLYSFGINLAVLLSETVAHYYIKDSLFPYMPQGFPQSNLDTRR